MDEQELIFDWNAADGASAAPSRPPVELVDETLRDGIQCPSVRDPSLPDKIEILHLMAALGIHAVDLGLPGAGPRAVEDVRALAREIAAARLPLAPNCAARTVRADIEPVARISQEVGYPIEVAAFIGSSPIRQYAEGWSLDDMLRATEDAVSFAVGEGLPVMYVTEDTTRARPEALRRLYTAAIDCGARRICLADTVGHAAPAGVQRLVRFILDDVVRPAAAGVRVDWHGHRDRGLAVANSLAAVEAGVDRVHGTALGVGERVGNAEIDLLLVNLRLLGYWTGDLSRLPEYCERAARALDVPIPPNYPVFGADAFRTGTGVHAAAIIKAKEKGHDWLADRIYSGVPAADFGRRQRIEVSHVSGLSNVRYWLAENGYDAADEALASHLFGLAKRASRVLGDDELHECCRAYGLRLSPATPPIEA